ncbi:MAG: Hsp20/alpha crystallin family protein [Raineya sp.]|nr:Hsp20/alpha crystallin family protein [Raineya sp.]
MNLLKWTKNLKPKFPAVIEKFWGKIMGKDVQENEEVGLVPSVNISEAEKAFEIAVAVPGLDKKDLKIEVEDGFLRISSEKQYEKEEREKNWLRREFGYACFQRVFQIPESADTEKVNASLKNGILTIKMAKKKGFENSVRRIEVK